MTPEFRRGVEAAIEAGERAAEGVSVKTGEGNKAGELQLRALTAAFDAMRKLIGR